MSAASCGRGRRSRPPSTPPHSLARKACPARSRPLRSPRNTSSTTLLSSKALERTSNSRSSSPRRATAAWRSGARLTSRPTSRACSASPTGTWRPRARRKRRYSTSRSCSTSRARCVQTATRTMNAPTAPRSTARGRSRMSRGSPTLVGQFWRMVVTPSRSHLRQRRWSHDSTARVRQQTTRTSATALLPGTGSTTGTVAVPPAPA